MSYPTSSLAARKLAAHIAQFLTPCILESITILMGLAGLMMGSMR